VTFCHQPKRGRDDADEGRRYRADTKMAAQLAEPNQLLHLINLEKNLILGPVLAPARMVSVKAAEWLTDPILLGSDNHAWR
jgi:hypothetical protein